jgi:double-strand break repair protein MRE11
MFHENKPSRQTMHKTLKIFREQCLGDDPVYIQCVNQQSAGDIDNGNGNGNGNILDNTNTNNVFRSNGGRINYEDPFHSVSLPYFAIHGNHDDPSREGSSGDALAALDVLAISNYINYFGKSDRADDVEITPILLNKNGTKLALYGLGAIRDERLNRMWRQKKVKFVRPRENDDDDVDNKWFNILILHQNRDYGRGVYNHCCCCCCCRCCRKHPTSHLTSSFPFTYTYTLHLHLQVQKIVFMKV